MICDNPKFGTGIIFYFREKTMGYNSAENRLLISTLSSLSFQKIIKLMLLDQRNKRYGRSMMLARALQY